MIRRVVGKLIIPRHPIRLDRYVSIHPTDRVDPSRNVKQNMIFRVIQSVAIRPTDRLDPSRAVGKHIIPCLPVRLDPSGGSS